VSLSTCKGGAKLLVVSLRTAEDGLCEPRERESVAVKQEHRRIKELERELHRKDKALAETAALLVLAKKLQAVFHEGEDV
jgi:transposase